MLSFFRERQVKSALKDIDNVVSARRKTIQGELALCRQQARVLDEEKQKLMAAAVKSPRTRDKSAEAHWQRKQTQNERVKQNLETQLMQLDKACQQRDRAMQAKANTALLRSQAKLNMALGDIGGIAIEASDDNKELVDGLDKVERAMSEMMEPSEFEQELEGKEVERQLDEVDVMSIFDEAAKSNGGGGAVVVAEVDRLQLLLREQEQMNEEIERLKMIKPKKAKKKAIAHTQPITSATKIE